MRDVKRRTDSPPPQGCERRKQAAATGIIAAPRGNDGSHDSAAFCADAIAWAQADALA